ncbi:MAG: ACT domain-containing protein [Pseudomonadota bacterium]
MKQLMVISAVGSDRPGLVHDLTAKILECGGNVMESRMVGLGSEFAMLMLIGGNWHTLARLEGELERLGEDRLAISVRRTEERAVRGDLLPYAVDVVCLDHEGIVSNLAGFFSQRGIEIAELSTRSYAAAHTGAAMFSVQMSVSIPSRVHIAALREEFMEFCDRLNLDAIMEPIKN